MARLVDSSGAVIIPALELADTFLKRLVGLQFRKSLPLDAGLCISPCSSIHTCFMRFSIDVYMVDRQGFVLKVRPAVRPWRLVIAPRGTYYIIETHVDAFSLVEGQSVRVV